MRRYDHKKIEKKWQEKWEVAKDYVVTEDKKKEKSYILVEFPYPSGDGLHVGHVRPYVAFDIVSRKRRAEGLNVLYPFGWDAFGLPTENYAIKTGIHPKEVTKKNTDNFRKQVKNIGISFDWSREINTTDPDYYKWTQWIFLQLYKNDLAYKACMPINWCIDCKIGLANEEVVDEVCERCGGEVEMREKEQWMLAITKYADRLEKDLDDVDYWERIKIQQRNWIGRSEGVELDFPIKDTEKTITVFTTRPDTLFGATYMVLAPEHSLVQELKDKIANWDEVFRYIETTKKKTETERAEEKRGKTGVELQGVRAVNLGSGEEIPIFIADYVLESYGTGAIMAVPAHDERDFALAKKFNLPIREVVLQVIGEELPDAIRRDGVVGIIKNKNGEILIQYNEVYDNYRLPGGGINEGETEEGALRREIEEETGYTDFDIGSKVGSLFVHYPNPVVKVNRKRVVGVYEVTLNSEQRQDVKWSKYEKLEHTWMNASDGLVKLNSGKIDLGEGELLGRYIAGDGVYIGEGILLNSEEFDGLSSEEAKMKISEKVGGRVKITYKLRDWIFSRQRYWGEPIPMIHCEKCNWVPVPEEDLPVKLPDVKKYQPTDSGESPLAVIDEWVNTTCPKCDGKAKRETDTMPNWAGSSWYYLRYTDPHNDKEFADAEKLKYWTPVDWYNGGMEHTTLHLLYSRFWHKFLYDIGVVPSHEPYMKRTSHGLILAEGGEKMSKSKGNVVNPDDVVKTFGADTLRLYEMFIGPFDQAISWNADNMVGIRRFVERVWRLSERVSDIEVSEDISIVLHQTIKKVGDDINILKFNTAISQLMICANGFEKLDLVSTDAYKTFLRLLAPFMPHVTEELWESLEEVNSIHHEPWPIYNREKLVSDRVTIVIQVDGRLRGSLEMPANVEKAVVRAEALQLPEILKWVQGKQPRKVIYVPGRLINFVLRQG